MTADMDEPQARRPGTVRRFFAHLRGRWRRPQTLPIYDFEVVTALMDGWQSAATGWTWSRAPRCSPTAGIHFHDRLTRGNDVSWR